MMATTFFWQEDMVVAVSPDLHICDSDNCTGSMRVKTGVYGKFLGCSNYPECTNTEQVLGNERGDSLRRISIKYGMPRLKDAKSHEERIKELEELVSNMAEKIESLEFYLDNSEVIGDDIIEDCFARDGSD